MANALYSPAAGADPYALDVSQFAHALQGTLDPGAVTFAGPSASPVAPSVALQSGSLSGAYQWCAWWITGVPVGGSATPNVNGTTAAGTATTTQALSSQEAVLTVPASPPSTAVGCGFGRTLAGGSVFYEIPGATVYKTAAGAWPQYTDNTADSSLVTAVPAANTTGTPLTLGAGATIPSGTTLAAAGATISGGPTFSGGAVAANNSPFSALNTGGTSTTLAYMDTSNNVRLGDNSNATPTLLQGASVETARSGVVLDNGSGAGSAPGSWTAAGFSNTLGLSPADGTAVTDSAWSSFLFFVISSTNWAGVGTYTNGLPWIRNGLDIVNSSGVSMARVTPGGYLGIGTASPAYAVDATAKGAVAGTQLVSTVATGTAPFTVASTTQVANLNVSGLGGTLEVEVATFIAQEGGAIGSIDINSDQVEIGTVSPNATYYFEAAVAGENGATVTITLYDATTATAVTSVTTASPTDTTAHRSGAITLTAGHQFYVQLTSANAIYSGGIARIVAKI